MRDLSVRLGRPVVVLVFVVVALASGGCWLLATSSFDAAEGQGSTRDADDGEGRGELEMGAAAMRSAGFLIDEPAEGYEPTADRDFAEDTVTAIVGDNVLDSALVRITGRMFDGHAWLVGVVPEIMWVPGPEREVRSVVAVVDAETGDIVLFHASSDAPPDEGGYFPTPFPNLDDIPEYEEALREYEQGQERPSE